MTLLYFTRLANYDPSKDAYKNGSYDTYQLWTSANSSITVEGKLW